MPTLPPEVYRRRRITVAVALLSVVTVVTVLVAYLLGGGAAEDAGSADPTATPSPTPVLPAYVDPPPVLPADLGGEPLPDPAVLAAALAPELADPRFGGPVSGRIVDTGGAVLFDADGTLAVAPASTLKLLTALAVELAVPPGLRLETTVVQGVEPGRLILVGGGDVTLARDPTETLYPGSASIADLAAQVRASGVPVTNVVVDTSYFSGAEVSPDWGSGDAPSRYAAPITPVMLDGGRTSPRSEDVRSGQPALAAGQALADALGVGDAGVGVGTANPAATPIATVRSAPVEQLVQQMLADSDNVLAEALARQVAVATGGPASFTGAATAVRDVLIGAGLDLSAATVLDGSGLAAANRVTVTLLTDVLLRAAGPAATPGRGLLAGLPVAGFDGTLAERYDDSTAAGEVRAKTGTLNGTSALAGVVETADGRLLVFAFVAHAVPIGGRYPAEAALDEVATILATCGCR